MQLASHDFSEERPFLPQKRKNKLCHYFKSILWRSDELKYIFITAAFLSRAFPLSSNRWTDGKHRRWYQLKTLDWLKLWWNWASNDKTVVRSAMADDVIVCTIAVSSSSPAFDWSFSRVSIEEFLFIHIGRHWERKDKNDFKRRKCSN